MYNFIEKILTLLVQGHVVNLKLIKVLRVCTLVFNSLGDLNIITCNGTKTSLKILLYLLTPYSKR